MNQPVLEKEVSIASATSQVVAEHNLPSYHPTSWKLVNQVLDVVDNVTHGKAGLFQRFFTFVCIGGLAALVNLAVFAAVMYGVKLPVSEWLHNVIASMLAAELSIMANFIPNDYFTFRRLAGHGRSWFARCLRFHITSIGGAVLTFLIQSGFRYIGHTPAIIGQAAALVITLFYNFSFHHLFTYRHMKMVMSAPETV
jgi:putative flippase GtrA